MAFLILMLSSVWAKAADLTAQCDQGILSLNCRDAPLEAVWVAILDRCRVDVSGMQDRGARRFTFSATGPVDAVIKKIFRQLGEKNFAFVYYGNGLQRVSVLPAAAAGAAPATPLVAAIPETAVAPLVKHGLPVPPPMPGGSIAQGAQESQDQQMVEKTDGQTIEAVSGGQDKAVEVAGVLGDSQAQALGLMEGDRILSYNGVHIQTPQQLVQQTQAHSDQEDVELVILRDQTPVTLTVEGGFIGIRIRPGSLPLPQQEAPPAGK
jgi:membrane-associated protease RseP (regulator of RpoE activity)